MCLPQLEEMLGYVLQIYLRERICLCSWTYRRWQGRDEDTSLRLLGRGVGHTINCPAVKVELMVQHEGIDEDLVEALKCVLAELQAYERRLSARRVVSSPCKYAAR